MKRDEILNQAKQCVTIDRQKVHGDAEDNFATIAALWKAYIEQACLGGEDALTILPEDVAAMMVLFKVARIASGSPDYADNWIDICGYAACGGEIGTKGYIPELNKDMSEEEASCFYTVDPLNLINGIATKIFINPEEKPGGSE